MNIKETILTYKILINNNLFRFMWYRVYQIYSSAAYIFCIYLWIKIYVAFSLFAQENLTRPKQVKINIFNKDQYSQAVNHIICCSYKYILKDLTTLVGWNHYYCENIEEYNKNFISIFSYESCQYNFLCDDRDESCLFTSQNLIHT